MTRCCESCKNVPCQVRTRYECKSQLLEEGIILKCLSILEEPDKEFAKHALYAEGKEYELWQTALNRIRESITAIQKLHPRYPEFIGEDNPCNECSDPTNCDEICDGNVIRGEQP